MVPGIPTGAAAPDAVTGLIDASRIAELDKRDSGC
jgi:hypothetical protein